MIQMILPNDTNDTFKWYKHFKVFFLHIHQCTVRISYVLRCCTMTRLCLEHQQFDQAWPGNRPLEASNSRFGETAWICLRFVCPLVMTNKAVERSTRLLMGKSAMSMVFFDSYVKLPEGTSCVQELTTRTFFFFPPMQWSNAQRI